MSANKLPYDSAIAPWEIPDPGNGGTINTAQSGVCNLVTAAAETRALAAPANVGQWLLLNLDTDGGDCVVTSATDLNVEQDNTLTFDDAGQNILLVAVTVGGVKRWTAPGADTASAGTNGPTLSKV
jgi:hypothetical protein